MVAKCTLLGMLGICSITDVRRQEIHSLMVLAFGIAGVLVHLWKRELSIRSLAAGAAIGLFVMLLSILSKGVVGIGDGLVLTVSGIYLGGIQNMRLLCGGLLLTAVYGCILLLFLRRKRTETIPFVPFLLVSYVGNLCI